MCLVLRLRDSKDEFHHLVLLAITSQAPRSDQQAVEIPETERHRAGLTRYPRAWVIVSEYNYDVADRSWYYQPGVTPLGTFSGPFVREIARALRAVIGKRRARVDRTV